MKKILQLSILIVLIPFIGHSQVMMKEMLTQEQKGMIDKSVNWPGKKVYYALNYDSTEVLTWEGKSTNRYYYTLMLADNSGMNNAITVGGMVRDLVITTYFEFYFNNGTETKTFTLIYDKNNKWFRIKFAPQAGCRREELWTRINDITSYQRLLSEMVEQMDNNLILGCYKNQKAMISSWE